MKGKECGASEEGIEQPLLRDHCASLSLLQPLRVTLFRDYMSLHPSLWSNPLPAKVDEMEFEPGFQPLHCFQLLPASSVTTLASTSDIKL